MTCLIRRNVWLSGLAALLIGAAALRADQASEWEAARLQQRQNEEQRLAAATALPTTRPSDVMEIRLDNSGDSHRRLAIFTRLSSTPPQSQCRVNVPGSNLAALISVRGGNDDGRGDAVVPSLFQLTATDYSTPHVTTLFTINSQSTNSLSLCKSVLTPTGELCFVTIVEEQDGDSSDEPQTVQLTVNEFSSTQNHPPQRICIEAPDFWTLVRLHPQECEQYVRPLLRELGQEAVFAPDPLVAWQVFSDQWKADADVQSKVTALLPQLEEPDYRVRERVVRSLVALGRPGAAVMVHLDRTRLSPQQNAQVDRALLPFAQLPVSEATKLRTDPSFLLDCLYEDDLPIRQAALNALQRLVGPRVDMDVNASLDARVPAVAAARTRLLGK